MFAAMAKSKGMSKSPMGSKIPMDEDEGYGMGMEEGGEEEDDGKGSKLLALQNLLGAISELVDEDVRPDVERMKNQVHMQHEGAEGDELGVQEAKEHEDMGMEEGSKKPGVDITIGMGAKPPKDMGEGEEGDEDLPKSGFLAVLSKKLSKKPSK